MTVVEEIIVDLYTPSNLVDLATSLMLYANGTTYASTGSQSGLYFRWVCPEIFQTVCDEFEGLPIMELTPEAFEANGGRPLIPYDF